MYSEDAATSKLLNNRRITDKFLPDENKREQKFINKMNESNEEIQLIDTKQFNLSKLAKVDNVDST